MRKIIGIFLILAVFTASAQKTGMQPSIEERLKRTTEILTKELELNSTQINTANEALNAFFKQVNKLLKNNPLPPNPNQLKQIESFEKERDRNIISTLNERQVKKYNELVLKLRPPKSGQ